jgi:DHA1 family inner membrane transport protein
VCNFPRYHKSFILRGSKTELGESMDSKTAPIKTEKGFKLTFLVPILVLSNFLLFTISVLISTLLVDFSSTFDVSIGTASQGSLSATLTGLVMGFVVSAISVKFNHKSLLLAGITLYAVGALVLFFAPNFAIAIVAAVLSGAGGTMTGVMIYTLIGDHLPLERRGWAVGLVMSAVMAAFVIVAILSGTIASVAGWRTVLLWFIIPLSLICLVLCAAIIPWKNPEAQAAGNPSIAKALKKLFTQRSPIACVLSTTLTAFIAVVPIYAVSYYRIDYSVSPAVGGLFSSVVALGGVFGAAFGGRLVNRVGRKKLAVTSVFVSGVAAMLFTLIPNMVASVIVWAVSATTAAMTWAGLSSLNLEQVPEYRASMMSIAASFDNTGVAIGVIIGGIVLNLFANNFHLLMVILGALAASAAAVLFFFAKDPCTIGSRR